MTDPRKVIILTLLGAAFGITMMKLGVIDYIDNIFGGRD
jgi:hypothetical protein